MMNKRCLFDTLICSSSVRPKPGFGIGNRNQDEVLVLVLEPKLFLPKPKLPPLSFLKLFSCFLCFVLNICQVIGSNHDAFLCKSGIRIENAKLVTKTHIYPKKIRQD